VGRWEYRPIPADETLEAGLLGTETHQRYHAEQLPARSMLPCRIVFFFLLHAKTEPQGTEKERERERERRKSRENY